MTYNEKSTELMKLLTPHRSGNIMQRVQAYVVNKTGKKLTEYLGNGSAEEEKAALLDELITICREEQWDQLPAAAGGQQVAVGASTTTLTSKPAAAPKPLTPAAAPKAAIIHTPKAAVPIAAQPEVTEPEAVDEPPAPVDPITAAITALQAAIAAKPAPAPADLGLSVDEVRYVVRKEIASVFRTIAEVLEAQAK